MCLPKKPKDNSAEIARREEEQRQARIGEGRANIDQEFGQFNDDFYSGYQDDYLSYYNPQAQDQYKTSREKLMLSLAESGNINAGAGAEALGKLDKSYETSRGDIASQAADAANQRRNEIEGVRSELYSQNRAAADPSSAAAQAAARSGGLIDAPAYSPIGDLFGQLLTQYAVNRAGGQRREETRTPAPLFSPGGSSSARVVN
jgi:hypothetical protein